jgi:hypothetical protein
MWAALLCGKTGLYVAYTAIPCAVASAIFYWRICRGVAVKEEMDLDLAPVLSKSLFLAVQAVQK